MDLLILILIARLFKLNMRKLLLHYLVLAICVGIAVSMNYTFSPSQSSLMGGLVKKENPGAFAEALLDVAAVAYLIFIGLIIMGNYKKRPVADTDNDPDAAQ